MNFLHFGRFNGGGLSAWVNQLVKESAKNFEAGFFLLCGGVHSHGSKNIGWRIT